MATKYQGRKAIGTGPQPYTFLDLQYNVEQFLAADMSPEKIYEVIGLAKDDWDRILNYTIARAVERKEKSVISEPGAIKVSVYDKVGTVSADFDSPENAIEVVKKNLDTMIKHDHFVETYGARIVIEVFQEAKSAKAGE